MAAGYNLKAGEIRDYNVSEEKYWSLFNYVFSTGSHKANTYKFGFLKSILDNLFNIKPAANCEGVFLPYEELFAKFAENYWNLVVKYNLRQMYPKVSKVEQILQQVVQKNNILAALEFDSLDNKLKHSIVSKVTTECKKYVVGAFYGDVEGLLYSFDLKVVPGIVISNTAYEFMLNHKTELERLNYYAWAQFLETVNDDNVLIRLLEKIDLATPRRQNLSVYREILYREFEQNNCFYCGKKLEAGLIHVDHFIPWSFVKDDKLWNFVLACPTCNTRKNNKLPKKSLLGKIEQRNELFRVTENVLVKDDFKVYSADTMDKMWLYARKSGLKEYVYSVSH